MTAASTAAVAGILIATFIVAFAATFIKGFCLHCLPPSAFTALRLPPSLPSARSSAFLISDFLKTYDK